MERVLLGAAALALAVAASPGAGAGEIPEAAIVLEVLPPPAPGFVPEAAPPRFVLLDDGTVFVGGTSDVVSAKLDKDVTKGIEKQVSRVRKLPGLGSSVTLGPGTKRYRLTLKKGPTILAAGDTGQATAAFRPLAELLVSLEGFDHASLRPYRASQYALHLQQGRLPGGCRPWTFGAPPAAGSGPRIVPADAASDWPVGATAGSACAGDATWIVALRPLLPGERP